MEKDVYKIIGERLKSSRNELDLTQESVSERAGISLNFYGQIERGTKKASVETLFRLCRVLHIDSGALWGEGKPLQKNILLAKELHSLIERLSPEQRKKAILVLKEIFGRE